MNVRQVAAETEARQTGKAPLEASQGHENAGQGVRLRGRGLIMARVVWVAIAILAWSLFALAIPVRYDQLAHPSTQLAASIQQLGLSVPSYASYTLALEIIFALASSVLGLVLFWRKSDDAMALYASLLNIVFGV